MINIDFQTGTAFAGISRDGHKVTGVILPDATIRIKALGEGDLRSFGPCTLVIERGKYVMTGSVDMFDDLHEGVDEPDMGTFVFRAVRLN